jgi:hypothetical protein
MARTAPRSGNRDNRVEQMENLQGSIKSIAAAVADNQRILLVDTDPGIRKLRLASMSRMGMSVCCATDAAQARVMVRESPYAMVLIDLRRDRQGALKLRSDMQEDRPEQVVRFFVGKPAYLARNPLLERESGNGKPDDPKKMHALIESTCNGAQGHGRLQEAACRIALLHRQQPSPFLAATGVPSTGDSFAEAVRRAEEATPNEA